MAMLTPLQKNILTKRRVELINTVIVGDELLGYMTANYSLTLNMVDEIKAENIRSKQVAKLLDYLMRRSVTAYETLVRALVYTHQEHVATMLDQNLSNRFQQQRNAELGEHPQSKPNEGLQQATSHGKEAFVPSEHQGPVLPGWNPNPSHESTSSSSSREKVESSFGNSSPSVPAPVSQRPGNASSSGVGSQDTNTSAQLPSSASSGQSSSQPSDHSPMDVQDEPIDRVTIENLSSNQDTFNRVVQMNNQEASECQPQGRHDSHCSHRPAYVLRDGEFADLSAPLQIFFDKLYLNPSEDIDNLSLQELQQVLIENEKRLQFCDSFALYLLAFGDASGNVKMKQVSTSIYSEILPLFCSSNCPALRGKPKLFIFHVAELEASDERDGFRTTDVVDAKLSDPEWADMVIFRTHMSVTQQDIDDHCFNDFMLPFHALVEVISNRKRELTVVDAFREVSRILKHFKENGRRDILCCELSHTPVSDDSWRLRFPEPPQDQC